MARVFNFNPGPSTLPLAALQQCQQELLDYQGTGMSVLEISHRSKEFEAILADTKSLLKELMGIADDYHIVFTGGGASLQFSMLAQNFIPPGGSADYIVTGEWAQRALKEAKIIAQGRVAASSEAAGFSYIPAQKDLDLDPGAAFVHLTSNNTIFGTQWQHVPQVNDVPLVVDMSSDILSRRMDASRFAMIYAGAQKNLGPAGVTLAIIHKDFAARANKGLPTMLAYETHISKDSLYNTPPVFGIYIMKLVLQWVKAQGGLAEIERINKAKSDLLYHTVDASDGFYRGTVQPDSRSWMNATLRLVSEELEKEFVANAKKEGLVGLKGHRSVGGVRVSMYNAMPLQGVQTLVAFMKAFQAANG